MGSKATKKENSGQQQKHSKLRKLLRVSATTPNKFHAMYIFLICISLLLCCYLYVGGSTDNSKLETSYQTTTDKYEMMLERLLDDEEMSEMLLASFVEAKGHAPVSDLEFSEFVEEVFAYLLITQHQDKYEEEDN